MGDWYDFEVRDVDGEEVAGFSYQSKSTEWQEVFVELSPNQLLMAQEYMNKIKVLERSKDILIKSFLGV